MMTGVAWGGYQDYINGDFDGTNHMDEGQVQQSGEMIMHNPGVPYMVPSTSYIEYLKSKIKAAIDEGVSAIHLEEPEFWNRGGYSEGFKREWQSYYNEPWQAQHSSPDATYRSAKLKYHLYFRALKELFLFAKEYSEQQGRRVECYVPTHTLINYSAWGIVSPESSLSDLPGMDGSSPRSKEQPTPTYYQRLKGTNLENAFIDGSMLGRPAHRTPGLFPHRSIEDNPNHTWEDYKELSNHLCSDSLSLVAIGHALADRIFRPYRGEARTNAMASLRLRHSNSGNDQRSESGTGRYISLAFGVSAFSFRYRDVRALPPPTQATDPAVQLLRHGNARRESQIWYRWKIYNLMP